MKYIIALGLVILLSACSTHELKLNPKYKMEAKGESIFSLKQGREISMDNLAKEVQHYPVIFVGDYHDVNKTHAFFNKFLQKLASEGYNLHLANEWFTPEENELLLSYTNDDINASSLKEKKEWEKTSRYRWKLVEELYESVKKSKGKLYGVNITKESRAKISLKELDKMSKEEREFYDSLDLNVSAHNSLVAPFFNHCSKMPKVSDENCAQRMYRVQVTWDTFMAKESAKIAQKVLKTPKDKLIVFAGAMHMEYGLGIPLRFSRLSNQPSYILSNQNYKEGKELEINPRRVDALFIFPHKE